MMRHRLVASAMVCLLLSGASLAAADRDHGRGDRGQDNGSRSEGSKKERSRGQRTTERGSGRDQAQTQRGSWSNARSGGGAGQTQREPWRETRREPSRDGGRETYQTRRETSHIVPDRWMPERRTTDVHIVSRTATPRDWREHALRGGDQYSAWGGYRASRWQYEHRPWRSRGGYQGYWIPDYRYRTVFGPRHIFRVDNCPLVIVSGYPRFYYGGYWVTFIDPWPEYWDDDWYEQDDCYVVRDTDGYYLMNSRYPSVRIAVSFTIG